MGQYYASVIIGRTRAGPFAEARRTWDSHTLAKLTEHAWVGNGFVNATVERLNDLTCPREGRCATARLAWVGDYAVPGECECTAGTADLRAVAYAAAWCDEVGCAVPYSTRDGLPDMVALNWDREEAVMLKGSREGEGWQAHPLPILTAMGNGMGGGDYDGPHAERVGTWALDRLTVFRPQDTGVCPELREALRGAKVLEDDMFEID